MAKLSVDFLNKLALESDLGLGFFKNLGILIPPVIRLEVDFDSSFISDILDKSITDFESFLRAEGVRLLSKTSRAASVSKDSGSTLGQT